MVASEFAFLVLGLVLGIATGGALFEVLRARPPAPRQIRITVAPDSVPRRRSATLSADPFMDPVGAGTRSGPVDHAAFATDRMIAVGPAVDDTRYTLEGGARAPAQPGSGAASASSAKPHAPTPKGTPVRTGWDEGSPSDFLPPRYGSVRDPAAAAGFTMRPGGDPALAAVRRPEVRSRPVVGLGGATTALLEPPATRRGRATTGAQRAANRRSGTAIASVERSRGPAASEARPTATARDPVGPGSSPAPGPAPSYDGPCAEPLRAADERCGLAERAQRQAEMAAAALRDAQQAYDAHLGHADRAAATADPRALRSAKETAHHRFRADRDRATSQADVEAAARGWLQDINRINVEAREAANQLVEEREAASAMVTAIERLTVEADAARITAEAAQEACIAAQQAAADCAEAAATGQDIAASQPLVPPPTPTFPVGPPPADAPPGELAAAASNGGRAAILALLTGDRATMQRIVGTMAGDDQTAQRHWQVQLADLVDAIVARAIEAGALDFPEDHLFWGAFTPAQDRDIAMAMASIGFRFDGLGGYLDERIPSQRDLSLAVGYAGLDPMRTRHWPTEAEIAELFRDVTVAADEYLAAAAGGLTLGELISLLGRRADSLTEVWNAWARLRPLLLETA